MPRVRRTEKPPAKAKGPRYSAEVVALAEGQRDALLASSVSNYRPGESDHFRWLEAYRRFAAEEMPKYPKVTVEDVLELQRWCARNEYWVTALYHGSAFTAQFGVILGSWQKEDIRLNGHKTIRFWNQDPALRRAEDGSYWHEKWQLPIWNETQYRYVKRNCGEPLPASLEEQQPSFGGDFND